MNEEYTPNFNDPRVIKKCNTALDFVVRALVVRINLDWSWSSRYLDESFGQINRNLSKYLRSKLLIVTDDSYYFNEGSSKTKKYKVNEDGVISLIKLLGKNYVELNNITVYSNPLVSRRKPKVSVNVPVIVPTKADSFVDELRGSNIRYTQKSQRQFHALQYLPKADKHEVFARANLLYEYDVNSCAPTIIYQTARNLGMKQNKKYECYLSNTQMYRNYLMELLTIDKKTAKIIITALFAGALIRKSIAKLLKYNTIKVNRLLKSELITELRKEISKTWKFLRPHLISGKRLTAKDKWELYFTHESHVLSTITEYLKETGNHHFTEHDGWVARNPVNIEELTIRVHNETGFKLTFSEEVLKDTHLVSSV